MLERAANKALRHTTKTGVNNKSLKPGNRISYEKQKSSISKI